MKYLALDTNIYLDMVVSRNKSHKSESYYQMLKLLDYGEIRLLVPSVIITEVKRHIDHEINKIYENLKRIKKSVDSLYWINNVEEMKAFSTSIPTVKSGINDLHILFEANKNKYISDADELFNNLFSHRNVKILEETEEILFKANKRKLHKKRPFHYNEPDKDSIADAVIIETLINIKDLIDFTDDDQLFFISRNTVDFSEKQQVSMLHEDIKRSLRTSGVIEQFHYSIHFTKTLVHDFKNETENAGVLEELQKERELELYEELDFEEIERNREAGGLTSLSANWDEIISEHRQVLDLLQTLNDYKEDLLATFEAFSDDYFEMIELIENLDLVSAQSVVNSFNHIENNELRISSNLEEMIEEILDLFTSRVNINPEDFEVEKMWKCEEVFDLSKDLLEFKDFNDQSYRIYVKGELNPEDRGHDTIEINLHDNITGKSGIGSGAIEISYGYLNFDEDGHAADGLQEEIDVHLENVLETSSEVYEQINNQIEMQSSTLEYLKNSMGL